MLEARAEHVERVPIVFTVGERQFPIKASSLGVEADWQAALRTAASEGEGFGPVRGFKRLQTRFFGAEISPPVQAYTTALDYKLGQIADEIDRNHVEAKLVRRGLAFAVVPGQAGLKLDRDAAADAVVRALAKFERGGQVPLPVVSRSRLGDRGRARARRTTGASRRLRARPADLGGDALEAASLAGRDAAPVARERVDLARDRRTRRSQVVPPPQAGRRSRSRWMRRSGPGPAWSRSSRTRTGSRWTRRRPPPRCWRRRRARRTARPSSCSARQSPSGRRRTPRRWGSSGGSGRTRR